jgi:hypothetical protein
MSSRPEEEDPVDEIEEGEIVSDEEEEEVIYTSDIEEDEGDFFEEDEDEGMDLAGLMSSLLATPDGDTVCSALVNLCYQLETQNKILIKMLAKMQPPKSA